MKGSVFTLFFSLIFAFTLYGSTEAPPFSVNVLVEEGENVSGWEKGIFGKDEDLKEKEKKEESDVNDEPEKKPEEKKDQKPEEQKEVSVKETETEDQEPEDSVLEEEPDPDIEKAEEEKFGRNDPKWGRYYGEAPKIEGKFKAEKPENTEKKDIETAQIIKNEDEEFMPIDLLLWSHGGDGYLAMINTGIRVSYLNMYSTLSVGTDYSDSIDRPMSLGLKFGGYYRMDDFLITADLGYEKIWDFGDNPELNDYALGLKAGLSYSIWSWFAISAGAGVNYNVLKNTTFEQGRFSPMFFGGFEFNLMK